MSDAIHPGAPHHLPPFITAPGETDYFYNGSAIFLVVMIVVLGSLYFRLHALPEHLAHGNADKVQFQLVGVLALLALFTHNNIFWVAALVLAIVPIPDFATPLTAMAESLTKMASGRWRAAGSGAPAEPAQESDVAATTVLPAGSAVAARPQLQPVGNPPLREAVAQPGTHAEQAPTESGPDRRPRAV